MSEQSVTAVAHVLWSGNVGGIERLVTDLAAEQARQGLRVTIAFGRAEGPFAESSPENGVRVVDLALASGHDFRPSHVRRGVAALRDVDVIHLHAFNPALAALTQFSRRPVVFTEHGNFGLGRNLRGTDRIKRRLQRVFLRSSVSAIAANSNHTAERLSALYGIRRSSVAVVHNGIARHGGDPGVTYATRADLHLAFVGRLVAFKRVDRVIRALRQATHSDTMRLHVVGAGPLEANLRSLARSLDVTDLVQFRGFRRDVPAVLAACDVLVQPSEGEPFGLAILEACAAGALPIAFADGGGALEVLPPDGIVVESVRALAAALDDLIGSPALSVEARRNRATWVRDRFPISRTATGYRNLYQTAAERAKR